MPHIALPEGLPGIIGPLTKYPESGRQLSNLAQTVLRGPSSLTEAEREMIATYVSSGNECNFCMNSHAAATRHLLGDRCGQVDEVLDDLTTASVSEKLRSLLAIADKVRRDGRLVTPEDVSAARAAGADDQAIHDTVLIAAMFCMYNRYVDGLATNSPPNRDAYTDMGAHLATHGYVPQSPCEPSVERRPE